ncbi:MAG: DUF262 domain-containing protein [Mollicutes bacterium UO1]
MQEDDEIFFIGQIVFSQEKEIYNIVDGQQRLVTIFLFLITFLEHFKQDENNKFSEIEDRILRLLFSVRIRSIEKLKLGNKEINLENSRIRFSDEKDNENYNSILKNFLERIPLVKGKTKKGSPNIQRTVTFFTEFLRSLEEEEEKLNFLEVVVNKLSFVEINLIKEKDIIDLFVALNETGLNLTESDFLRSLMIRLIGGKNKEKIQELAKE